MCLPRSREHMRGFLVPWSDTGSTRVPERVTWRIPHVGWLILRGPPYIIQISYANSLINNAGTERFIIPRYHRRLNTADLHANSPKDGGRVSLSPPPQRGTCPARSIRNEERNASERLSHGVLYERASAGKRPIILCRWYQEK